MFKPFLGLVVLIGSFSLLSAQSSVQLTDGLSARTFPVEMSGDGSRTFYFRWAGGEHQISKPTGTIYMREAGRAVPEQLADGVRVDWMKSSRDGSTLIFGVYHSNSQVGFAELSSLDVASKKVIHLATLPAHIAGVALAEEAGIIFVNAGGFIQPPGIWSIPWGGGPAKRISGAGGSGVTGLSADPKGESLYLATWNGYSRLDTRSGDVMQLPPPTKAFRTGRSFLSADRSSAIFADELERVQRYNLDTGKTELLLGDTRVRLESVSRDGKWLLLEAKADWTGENPDHSAELFVVSADGSIRKQLTKVDQFAILYGDAFRGGAAHLSDDGQIATVKSTVQLPYGGKRESLYRIVLSELEFQLLDATAPQNYSLLKILGGDHHLGVVSSGTSPGTEAIVVRSDGSHFRRLGLPDLSSAGSIVAMSANADTLALSRSYKDSQGGIVREVSLYRVATGELVRVAELKEPPLLIPIFPSLEPIPVWMDAAGKVLVFYWSGKVRLAELTKEGPKLKEVAAGYPFAFGVSADGRWVVFQDSKGVLFTVRTDGSELREIGGGTAPQLSRDGEWVVFLRLYGEVVLARTDGTFQKRLTTPRPQDDVSFNFPQISADGNVVVVTETTRESSGAFVAYDRQGAEIGRVSYLGHLNSGGQLDSKGERIYFASDSRLLGDNSDASQEIFVARFKPFQQWVPDAPSGDELFTGIALTNLNRPGLSSVGLPPDALSAEVTFAARDRSGMLLVAPGVENPVTKRLAPGQQSAWLVSELFGSAVLGRAVSVEIGSGQKMASYFLVGSNSLDRLEGASASQPLAKQWRFPLAAWDFASSALVLVNPNDHVVTAQLQLGDPFGRFKNVTIAPRGTVSIDVLNELAVRSGDSLQPLLRISSSLPLGAELRLTRHTGQGRSTVSVQPIEPLMASDLLIFPHVLEADSYQTRVWIANPTGQPTEFEVEVVGSDGRPHPGAGTPIRRTLAAEQMFDLPLSEVVAGNALTSGYLRVRALTQGGRIAGVALVSNGGGSGSLFVVDSTRPIRNRTVFPHLAQSRDFFTGYAAVNPFDFPVQYKVEIFDNTGAARRTETRWLAAREKHAGLLSNIYQQDQLGGYFVITSDWPIFTVALIGTTSNSALANLPPQ